MSSPGEKLRALFMASLMVLSVVAATVAFSGAAAAASNASFTANPSTPGANSTLTSSVVVGSTVGGSSVQAVTTDFTPASNFDGGFANVEATNVTVTIYDSSGTQVRQYPGNVSLTKSNGAKTLKVAFDSYQVQQGYKITVTHGQFKNPSSSGSYAATIDLNPQSSGGQASGELAIGNTANALTAELRFANGTATDTFDKVNDDVVASVDHSGINNATLSAKHYVDGQLVATKTLQSNSTGVAQATFSAAKDGKLVFYNGSSKFDTELYTANDYEVNVLNAVKWGTTSDVRGEIVAYNGSEKILADNRNIDYALYNTSAANSGQGHVIAKGDTDSGKFLITRTFDDTPMSDKDYPASGASSPAYRVFVKSDVNNDDMPTPNASNNDGSDIVKVRLDYTLDSPAQGSVAYGETVDVTGSFVDGDGQGVANYPVEVRNGTWQDANDGVGKTRSTTTASNGAFGFTMVFNDAGVWSVGTNKSGYVQYDTIMVEGREANVSITPEGNNYGFFTENYTVQINGKDGQGLNVTPNSQSARGYVNITGPFQGASAYGNSSISDIGAGAIIAEVDSDGDGNADYFHARTSADGSIEFQATPVGSAVSVSLENNVGGTVYDGVEDLNDAADSPQTPDYVGSASANVQQAAKYNLVEFDIKDPQVLNQSASTSWATAPGWNYTSIFSDSASATVNVLPFANKVSQRRVGGLRLGNDTYQSFSGMTFYRVSFELRDENNNPIAPGNATGELRSISFSGAGVNGKVVGKETYIIKQSGKNVFSGPIYGPNVGKAAGTYYILVRPTQVTSPDENFTVSIDINGTDSAPEITRSVPAVGLQVTEFLVDGESVNAVEPKSTINVSAVVRNASGVPINNGRVRVSQNGTALASIDARTANVNDGEYKFTNIPIGPRGQDKNGDGIAESTSQLVFTAYQYADADNNQKLEQSEVDKATVETLGIALDESLQVDYVAENTSAYAGVTSSGQFTLTRGVEYERIAFTLTDGDGNAVNLTDGVGNNYVALNDLANGTMEGFINLTSTNFAGNSVSHAVIFNESASRPGDGYYVIADIEEQTSVSSTTNGLQGSDNFTFTGGYALNPSEQFGNQTFTLNVMTPGRSKATDSDAGQFQVADANIDTEVVGVTDPTFGGQTWNDLAHNQTDVLNDTSGAIETLTIGINRTYRVNVSVTDALGTPIDGDDFDEFEVQYNQTLERGEANVTMVEGPNVTVETANNVVINDGNNFEFDIRITSANASGQFRSAFEIRAHSNVTANATSSDLAAPTGVSTLRGVVGQNPVVEVYDRTGAELPQSDDSGNPILAKDVLNQLRVEAFPADGDDFALPNKRTFKMVGPMAQSLVLTKTENSTKVVTDGYEYGQLGFLSVTPTGTGTGIIDLVTEDGTPVYNTNGSKIQFDVLESNLRLNVKLNKTSVTAGNNLTVTLTARATNEEIENARVSIVDPTGTTVAQKRTNANGQVTFSISKNASAGTWTVSTRAAGYEPASQDFKVVKGGFSEVVNDFQDPPTSTDNDAQLEDINGDGTLNIVDVQALFAYRNSATITNNVDRFDFNNDGKIDVVDIQALFNEYRASQ